MFLFSCHFFNYIIKNSWEFNSACTYPPFLSQRHRYQHCIHISSSLLLLQPLQYLSSGSPFHLTSLAGHIRFPSHEQSSYHCYPPQLISFHLALYNRSSFSLINYRYTGKVRVLTFCKPKNATEVSNTPFFEQWRLLVSYHHLIPSFLPLFCFVLFCFVLSDNWRLCMTLSSSW